MPKVLRWAGYVFGGLAVIAAGAVLFVWASRGREAERARPAQA